MSLVLAFSLSSSVLIAETQNFKGSFKLGYRFLDTEGSLNRYKQHINLEQGAYLPEFSLQFTPTEALQNLFDRLDINIRNLGNEPFQSFDLSLQKFGKYQFSWARRKSTYFYSDDYEIGGGQLYDMHSFDFDRVSDSGSLKVWLGENIQVFADYNGYTKNGASITTLDLNRIEFEFDKPISENNQEITAGINAHWKGYSFTFEQKFQEYENDFGFFLPGYMDGGSGARYPADLLTFTQNQPYDFKTNTSTFRATAQPLNGLLIKGSAQLSDMDMSMTYDEAAAGTSYLNQPFAYSSFGDGDFQRKINLYDLDLTWMITNSIALVGAVRQHDFTQEGTLTIDGVFEKQDFGYDTLGVDAGLQIQLNQAFTLTGGYRFEERTLENLETFLYEDKTQRNGFFGNVALNLNRKLRITLDYESSDYDNPYTLISPATSNRIRGTARLNLNQVYASAVWLYNKTETDRTVGEPWASTRAQLNLRAGYHGKDFKLFAGYGLVNVEHEVDRIWMTPPGYSGPVAAIAWDIMYEGKSTLWDASAAFNITDTGKLGAYVNLYNNSGFWEIKRTMLKAYFQYDLPYGMFAEVALRHVNFEEEMAKTNDYKTNILELNFGYRWQ